MAKRKPGNRTKSQQNRDGPSAASENGNSGWRRVLPIAVLLVMAAILGWVARGIPHQCIRNAEKAIESWQFETAKQHLLDYPSWGTAAGKVYFLQARVDRHQAGYVRAISYLNAAEESGFDPQAIASERALIEIQNGNPPPDSMNQFDTVLRQSPDNRPAIYEVFAIAQFHTGNFAMAFETLDRWTQEQPRDGRPFYWKGWMHQLLKDNDAALAMYVESTKRNPKLVDSHLAQAAIWANRLQYDRAEQAYRVTCELDPDRVDTRIALGNLLWKLNRKSDAVDLLEPITKQAPSIYLAGRMVAHYYTLQQQPTNVISILQPMMQEFSDDAGLNYMLASAYDEIGNTVESKKAMQKFFVANENLDRLRANRFDVPLEEQYAEVLRRASAYRKYDWEQSLKWLNLATQSQPDNPEPHVLLARLHRESGSLAEAVREENIADSLAHRH